jgi:uncharacterized protein YdeI (BOF family)
MKQIVIGLLFILAMATAAMSAEKSVAIVENGPVKAMTVAEAKVNGVDTQVDLTGHIVRVVKDNEVMFSDETGDLMVYMPKGALDGVDLKNARIEVVGTIAQNFMVTEVNASSIIVK